jgi:hypothetical protein
VVAQYDISRHFETERYRNGRAMGVQEDRALCQPPPHLPGTRTRCTPFPAARDCGGDRRGVALRGLGAAHDRFGLTKFTRSGAGAA